MEGFITTQNPHASGHADGLAGRECKSPWRDLGREHYKKNEAYVAAYMRGQKDYRRNLKMVAC